MDEAENLMYQEKKSFYTSIHQQEIPGRNVKMTEPEGEAEPGGVTDILEEAQVKQLAGEMLRLYFEKQDVKGMLRHMDASCIWTDEDHQRVYGRREAELYFTRLADQYRGCRIEDLQQYSRKLAADTWLCCIWCYVDKPGENGKRIRMPFKDSKIMKKEQNGNFKCYFVHISRMVSAEDAMEGG
ncbi:MAG: nuclear transport factor 2 family protein [Eisenbergiella massiliensis]